MRSQGLSSWYDQSRLSSKNVSRVTNFDRKKKSFWEIDKAFEECAMEYLEQKTPILKELKSKGYETDIVRQKKGIDFVGEYKGHSINVDVKSIATNNFPTFCFEISGSVSTNQTGWLLDPEKETDYYLLTYHEVEGYGSNYKDAKQHMNLENVVETEAYLISRKKIIETIKTHLKSDNYEMIIDQIRNMSPAYKNWKRSVRFKVSNNSVYPYERNDWKGANYVYLTLSAQLREQPINIVVNRELLKEMAEEIWYIS